MAPVLDHDTISAVIAAGWHRLIGTDRSTDVIGFSFGGVIAAHFATRHPELVRRLILVGTGGLDTPLGHITLRGVRGLDEAERRVANRENLLALMLHDPASVDELALYLHALNASRARLDPVPLVLPDKLRAALPRLSMQVDAIWGEHDRAHPDPAAQEAVLRRFHPALDFRIIAGAGHWVMYERPVEFNRTVVDLLSHPLR